MEQPQAFLGPVYGLIQGPVGMVCGLVWGQPVHGGRHGNYVGDAATARLSLMRNNAGANFPLVQMHPCSHAVAGRRSGHHIHFYTLNVVRAVVFEGVRGPRDVAMRVTTATEGERVITHYRPMLSGPTTAEQVL